MIAEQFDFPFETVVCPACEHDVLVTSAGTFQIHDKTRFGREVCGLSAVQVDKWDDPIYDVYLPKKRITMRKKQTKAEFDQQLDEAIEAARPVADPNRPTTEDLYDIRLRAEAVREATVKMLVLSDNPTVDEVLQVAAFLLGEPDPRTPVTIFEGDHYSTDSKE